MKEPSKNGSFFIINKMKSLHIFLFSLIFNISYLNAQNNKGSFYLYWGWNRSAYTNSDIQFKGNDYNFTIQKAVAHDRPSEFDGFKTYFNPVRLTIPQVNYRIGYFITDKIDISIGVDHMKYVVDENQYLLVNGQINTPNTIYNGIYDNRKTKLSADFLTFEHTDGLNYINVSVKKHSTISKLKKSKTKQIQLNFFKGLSVGLLFPKTNTSLLNNERYDEYHISGWGLAAEIGLTLQIYKHFFIQTEYKLGYINMPNIRTTKFESDRASQQFGYVQGNLVFGYRFNF